MPAKVKPMIEQVLKLGGTVADYTIGTAIVVFALATSARRAERMQARLAK